MSRPSALVSVARDQAGQPLEPADRPEAARASRWPHVWELAFILPVAALVTTIVLVPAGAAFWHSLTNWAPGYPSPYVGLANYRELVHSTAFAQILENEAIYLLGLPIWVFLPLVVAVMLHDGVPFAGFFRTIYFFPSILAPALLGVLFKFILTEDGMLNGVLGSVGLEGLERNWLATPSLVKPTIIFILAWAGMGTGVVIYAAGLSSIPSERFEAAEIDGASWFQRLRYVVIPELGPIIVLWTVFQVISVFLFLFAWIFVLTQGGPGYASMTLDYDVYHNAFDAGYFGIAAAESVVIFGIVVAILTGGWILRKALAAGKASHAGVWALYATGGAFESIAAPLRSRARAIPRPSWSMPRFRWSFGKLALLILLAIVYIYPFVFLVSMALRTADDYASNPLGFPSHLTLDHLRGAWTQANMGRAIVNSFFAVGVGVVITVLTSALGAFWLRRHPGRLGSLVLAGVVAVWLVPVVIFLLPLFVTLSRLSLTNNLVVLGVIYAALNVPFGLYFLHSYYKQGLPTEVLEAADVDGASVFRTFRSVVLPLSAPALAALAALTFVWSWGDLLIAVILLADPSKYTVTVAAASIVGRFDFDIQTRAASAVIALLPMLLIFLVAQRAIVRGFTTGIGK